MKDVEHKKEDVYFDEITRKIIVKEKQTILGKKRRRGDDPLSH